MDKEKENATVEEKDYLKQIKEYFDTKATKTDLIAVAALLVLYSKAQDRKVYKANRKYVDDSFANLFSRAYRR